MTGSERIHHRPSLLPLLSALLAGTMFCCLVADCAAQSKSSPPRRGGRTTSDRLELYRDQRQQLHKQFTADLEKLAAECNNKGLPEAAAYVLKQAQFSSEVLTQIDALPAEVQPEIPLNLPPEERVWRTQLRNTKQQHAKKLYLLCRRALNGDYPSYAYSLLREVARHDPDHKMVRRLLGFVRQGDRWLTPFQAKMARDQYVWHDRFGWLPQAHVERYEKGERYYKRRWISADKETALRQDFKNAWEIRTENYLIKTNHSLERGVEIAKTLEDFHDFFIQTFAGFFHSPRQLKKIFQGGRNGRRLRGTKNPYVVHYYSTREEYNERLRSKIPMIAITNGLYFTTDRIAYFFHDSEKNNDATLFHEATHQLFYEVAPRDRTIAQDRNFWIIEGIACYMESFERNGDRFSLGNPRTDRFTAARYRYLADGYYIPLARFSEMGLAEFQSDTQNIAKNYSQASGLSHFFMHYKGGRYRDALIEQLSELYQPHRGRLGSVSSLASLTNVEFEELDQQYGEYLKKMEASLAASGR